MEASKVWRVQARVNGLARRRSQRQEDHRVEYVRHLAHQKEPGKSVLAGGLPEISLQIGLLVRLAVDSKIRHHCQVNIPVVQKRRFPIDEPDAISVEEDVLRLQIVVALHPLRLIVAWVDVRYSRVKLKQFPGLALRQTFRQPTNESVHHVEVLSGFGFRERG